MPSIDDRIVNMQFNNRQFQKGIEETNSSLKDLRDRLNLSGATKGIDEVQGAANRFSLETIAQAVDNIQSKFSVLGAIGFTIIQNLTNYAIDAGKNLASALVDPIVQGGSKRALALQQARFQFQGLGLDIEATMNAALAAVKGTAFGLDDAATAAASFGATGITAANGLEGVLRSVAGVAAQTGSSYSQVANIFQTIAGNGRLMGDQLNQLASYGVNVAAIMSKQMGISEAQLRDNVSKGKVSFQEFSDAMKIAFGDNAAKANETYTGALSNMRAALARIGATVASPYFLAMRDIFNALGPAFDQIHEAIKPVLVDLGNFTTFSSENIVSGIKNFLGSGGLAAFENLVTLIQKLGSIVGTAFFNIFPDDTVGIISRVAGWLQRLTASLIPNESAAFRIRRIFEGVFAIFSIIGQVIGGVINMFVDLFGAVSPGTTDIADFVTSIATLLVNFDRLLKEGTLVEDFFAGLGEFLSVPIGILQFFFGLIVDGIKNFNGFRTAGRDLENFAEDVSERFSALADLGNFFKTVWLGLKDTAEKVWAWLGPIFTGIGNFVKDTVKNIGDALSGLKFENVTQLLNSGIFGVGTGGLLFIFNNFMNTLTGVITGQGGGLLSSINGLFEGLQNNLSALERNTNAKTIMQIAIAVGILAAAAVALSLVDAASLGLAMGAIVTAMGSLMASMTVLSKISGVGGIANAIALSGVMMTLSTAVLVLSGAIAILGALPMENLIQGTAALVVVLGALSGAMVLMSKTGPMVFVAAAALSMLAPSMVVFAAAIAIMGALPIANLAVGVGAFVLMLGALTGALALMAKIGPMTIVGAIAIGMIAPALLVLTGAIAALAAMPLANVAVGVGALVLAMAAITGAVLLLGNASVQALLGAVAISAIAWAIVPLIGAIALLGLLPMDNLVAGTVAFAAALAVLVGAVLILGAVGPMALLGAAALVAVAFGIATLAPALALLATISWDAIGRVLTILSAGLGILAVMGILLIPASVGFALFGAAVLLIGTGVFLAAEGIALLALGMAAIVGVGAGAFLVLQQALLVFLGMLPQIGAAIGQAIVSMAVVIGQNAPQLIGAFVSLILAMLAAIVEVVPAIVETAMVIIITLVDALVTLIPYLVDSGMRMLDGILQGISNNIEGVTQKAIDIIVKFINTIAANLGRIIDSGVNLALKFVQGIGDAVKKHSSDFTRAGSTLFRAIIDAVARAIEQGGKDIRYAGQRIGTALFNGAKSALDIRSPSRKFSHELMPQVFAGIEVGAKNNMLRASTVGGAIGDTLGDSAVNSMQTAVEQISDALDLSNMDTTPTIRPVVDLSDIQNKASQVAGLFPAPRLSMETSNDYAQSVSLQEQARNAQLVYESSREADGDRAAINYTQNNYSPKALTTAEVYRQTKNQLSSLRGELDVVDQSRGS